MLGACREALDAALEGKGGGEQRGSSNASVSSSSEDSDTSERSRRRRRSRRPLHRRLLGLVGRGGSGGEDEDVGGDGGWGEQEADDDNDDSPSPSWILAPSSPSSSSRGSIRQQNRRRPRLGAKLAGVHWWYGHPSHAAELTVRFFLTFFTFFRLFLPLLFFLSFFLTRSFPLPPSSSLVSLNTPLQKPLQAGYYNVYHRDGYLPLLDVLAAHGAAASLTCVEMRDCEHPPHAHCRPQALLDQVVAAASVAGGSGSSGSSGSSSSSGSASDSNASFARKPSGVPLAGENALQRYDDAAASALVERAASLSQLTFLRMGDLMFDNWGAFAALLARLRVRE